MKGLSALTWLRSSQTNIDRVIGVIIRQCRESRTEGDRAHNSGNERIDSAINSKSDLPLSSNAMEALTNLSMILARLYASVAIGSNFRLGGRGLMFDRLGDLRL